MSTIAIVPLVEAEFARGVEGQGAPLLSGDAPIKTFVVKRSGVRRPVEVVDGRGAKALGMNREELQHAPLCNVTIEHASFEIAHLFRKLDRDLTMSGIIVIGKKFSRDQPAVAGVIGSVLDNPRRFYALPF